MGQGDTEDTAARRLRQLNTYFLQHPVTGPVEGHTPSRTPAPPLSLATLDHITACRDEVVDHTRTANPAAGPLPARVEAIYEWARRHTAHTDDTVRQRTEVIEYRHYLENALRAGDRTVIRKQRCPECRTWGLMWQAHRQEAVCTNTECVDPDGLSNGFTLSRLAHEHVTARKRIRHVSAT